MTTTEARRIESEAKQRASLMEPPMIGQPIAWFESERWRVPRTDHLTPIHVVGEPIGGRPYTVCRCEIPNPIMWLALSPAILSTHERCTLCDSLCVEEGISVL